MQICQAVSKFILFPNSLQNDTAYKEWKKSTLSFFWHTGKSPTPAMGNQEGELSKTKTLQGATDLKCSSGKSFFRKQTTIQEISFSLWK